MSIMTPQAGLSDLKKVLVRGTGGGTTNQDNALSAVKASVTTPHAERATDPCVVARLEKQVRLMLKEITQCA